MAGGAKQARRRSAQRGLWQRAGSDAAV